MKEKLNQIIIKDFVTVSKKHYQHLPISYQIFGKKLHSAPIVVVFHALTGNSDVCSQEKGWWREIIGYNKAIDLNKYTVLSFDILGNGYNNFLIDNYTDFIAKDIAILSYKALQHLSITSIHAAIGGSLGGGIAWELIAAHPNFAKHLISIAADCKSDDWLKGICGTQEQILLNSKKSIEDARKMAMLFYRTPQSINKKFDGELEKDQLFKINSWLNHHGEKLKSRFSKKSYLMMNHLLSTINIKANNPSVFNNISSNIVQIGISSDLLFLKDNLLENKKILDSYNKPNQYYEIKSEHGHDAFLIENDQLSNMLKNYF